MYRRMNPKQLEQVIKEVKEWKAMKDKYEPRKVRELKERQKEVLDEKIKESGDSTDSPTLDRP